MLKQTITWTDFNDESHTEDVYFHLSKTDVLDMQDLLPMLEDFMKRISGADRTLTPNESLALVDIMRKLIRHSYGVRSEDGARFIKNDEVWNAFSQSGRYDAFFFSLLENNGENALRFITEIFPKDVREEIASAMQEGTTPVDTPKTIDDFSEAELLAMSQEDFEKLAGHDPNKMNQKTLRLAFMRKVSS